MSKTIRNIKKKNFEADIINIKRMKDRGYELVEITRGNSFLKHEISYRFKCVRPIKGAQNV